MRHFALEQSSGALITNVADNSPAARAGFTAGDVLLRFADTMVAGADALHALLGEERAGVPTAALLLRRTQLLDLMVTPEAEA